MSAERYVNYNEVAGDYDCRYRVSDYSGVERVLLEFVSTAGAGSILEVGCGTGHWLNLLVNQGYRVTGLDPSPGMLELARRQAPQAALVQGKAEALPWREKTFDMLFCVNATHHFTDKKAFMHEARRVLRPGGGVMTIGLDPHTGTDRWWIYDYFPQVVEIDKKRYPPTGEIRQMLEEAGFAECRTTEAQHIPWQMPARSALEKGRLAKSYTSQLTVLTDDEYNAGIYRLLDDVKTSEARNATLTVSADLRLYATTGWVK